MAKTENSNPVTSTRCRINGTGYPHPLKQWLSPYLSPKAAALWSSPHWGLWIPVVLTISALHLVVHTQLEFKTSQRELRFIPSNLALCLPSSSIEMATLTCQEKLRWIPCISCKIPAFSRLWVFKLSGPSKSGSLLQLSQLHSFLQLTYPSGLTLHPPRNTVSCSV